MRINDEAAPSGVRIEVSGSGTVPVQVTLTNSQTAASCGTLLLLPGSTVVATCGSLTLQVESGSATVVLSDDTALRVANGQTVVLVFAADGSVRLTSGTATLLFDDPATPAVDYTIEGGQVAAGSTIALWDFVGFAQPVDNNGVVNIAKGGSNIPLKWRLLTEAGAPVTNLASASVAVAAADCRSGNATEDPIEQVTPSASGLQNLGNGYYQLNWKTPKTTGCKRMTLSLGGEGTITHTALFKFN